MGSLHAADVVGRVCDTVDYLRVTVGPDDTQDWIPSSRLVDDTEALAALVRSTAAGRGTDRDDVAMSLFVQGYAFRIASLAIGGWLVADGVLDVVPTNTDVGLGRDRPNRVRLRDTSTVHDDDPLAALHDTLVERHLAPLVATAHSACRVGEKLLWANVGASCASSFGAFTDPLPDRRAEIRQRAIDFFGSARPELTASGAVVPVGPAWVWERNACCLWYRTESAFKCDDCSLWSPSEREARRARVLAEATP